MLLTIHEKSISFQIDRCTQQEDSLASHGEPWKAFSNWEVNIFDSGLLVTHMSDSSLSTVSEIMKLMLEGFVFRMVRLFWRAVKGKLVPNYKEICLFYFCQVRVRVLRGHTWYMSNLTKSRVDHLKTKVCKRTDYIWSTTYVISMWLLRSFLELRDSWILDT